MRTIFIILQFLVCSGYACPLPLDILPSNIKDFFDNYRNTKSKVFVTTGGRIVDAGHGKTNKETAKIYLHEMFYSPGESDDEVIYILSNEYSVLSADFTQNDEMEYRDGGWNLIKTTKEDHYRIIVKERVIGAIHDGNIDYSISIGYVKKINTAEIRYSIYITDDGPKVESDTGYSTFYILEQDVPKLMEHIQELNMVKPYKPDREKNKKADYVVEWW